MNTIQKNSASRFLYAKLLALLVLFTFSTNGLLAQENDAPATEESRLAISTGFLMGGGGLIGADLEFMPTNRLGLQAGVGLGSFGFGLNYHFQDRINSSFISLVYWQQGLGDNHYASYVGPLYTFRARRFFQASVGYGLVVNEGPAIRGTRYEGTTASLLFNIGLFFPL